MAETPDAGARVPAGQSHAERSARLASGLVLFSFIALHLANHALGLISLAAMESGRDRFLGLWRSLPGSALLAAAIVTHLSLAVHSIYLRRQFRMQPLEAAQLALGLCIPVLAVDHVLNTRFAHIYYGLQDSYAFFLLLFWKLRPELAAWQTVLVLVAWTHGCIGIHYWLRAKAWYGRARLALYTGALLLPVLALLGFVQGGRTVVALAEDPDWVSRAFRQARAPDAAARATLKSASDGFLGGGAGLLLLTLGARAARQWRERRRSMRITYPGERAVSVPHGYSVLETSRHAGIPHASVCGGRGRCSTCRVRVAGDAAMLPPASAAEARVLARVGAAPDVRLACQLRPLGDIAVTPLLPPSVDAAQALTGGRMAGDERVICILFADLRGFTRISEKRLPYDVVFLLNRYFETVGGAIERCGGVANQFTGDGVMALFGIESGAQTGARQALAAAQEMQRALARLSADLSAELPAPLKLGIGIHCGRTVVGHMGRGVATYLTAVGDAVNTASRLQDQTKQFSCQLIISEQVAERAGFDASGFRREEITVRNRDEAIAIRIIEDVESLMLAPQVSASAGATSAA